MKDNIVESIKQGKVGCFGTCEGHFGFFFKGFSSKCHLSSSFLGFLSSCFELCSLSFSSNHPVIFLITETKVSFCLFSREFAFGIAIVDHYLSNVFIFLTTPSN